MKATQLLDLTVNSISPFRIMQFLRHMKICNWLSRQANASLSYWVLRIFSMLFILSSTNYQRILLLFAFTFAQYKCTLKLPSELESELHYV